MTDRQPTSKDRRKLERFALGIPAKIEWFDSKSDRVVMEVWTDNISAGGAYFKTPQPMSIASTIRVNLDLPIGMSNPQAQMPTAHIEVTGNVLRSDLNGIAVGFDMDYKITPIQKVDRALRDDSVSYMNNECRLATQP